MSAAMPAVTLVNEQSDFLSAAYSCDRVRRWRRSNDFDGYPHAAAVERDVLLNRQQQKGQ